MSRSLNDVVDKDPASVEPWGIDWTDYLAGLGDEVVITTSAWAVSGPDDVLVVDQDSILDGNKKTLAFLSAGTRYARYVVSNTIGTNTNPAIVDTRSFSVYVDTPTS